MLLVGHPRVNTTHITVFMAEMGEVLHRLEVTRPLLRPPIPITTVRWVLQLTKTW